MTLASKVSPPKIDKSSLSCPKKLLQFYTRRIVMDLQSLKWTKNVKRADSAWAYSQFKVSDLFKLAWKDDEANANRPEKGDLILLRQQGYVTHLVRVLDYKSEREIWDGDYNIYRIVEVLWTIDFDNPPVSAKADAMFSYSKVLAYQGGNVMELESLPTFRQRWDDNGGLIGFRSYIHNLLALSIAFVAVLSFSI